MRYYPVDRVEWLVPDRVGQGLVWIVATGQHLQNMTCLLQISIHILDDGVVLDLRGIITICSGIIRSLRSFRDRSQGVSSSCSYAVTVLCLYNRL